MTKLQALRMRTAIATLMDLTDDERYMVAIQKREMFTPKEDWEVHVFIREKGKAGYASLATFMTGLEGMLTNMLCVESEYDVSTTGERDMRPSIKMW